MLMDNAGIDELIEAREMEIECHACHVTNLRTLGWMRTRHETHCDGCGELIVLGTADLRARMRNTERLLRALGDQLGEQLSHNLVGLSR
jgi:hypothetical protein